MSLIIFCSIPPLAFAEEAENISPLLSSLNIMVGDENGNMHYDKAVTRAEFTKIAVAASNYRNTIAKGLKTSSYKDVPATHWASPYVKVAVDNGLCKGYYDSTFKPDNTVTYEEAITILLRVLGYTDDDFGNSWPYGQIGIADSLGLSKGTDGIIGEQITRRKAALLVYNALGSKIKNSTQKLISIFDIEKKEDALIISESSKNIGQKKEVHTSEGTFKLDKQINENDIGKSGDLYIKDGDTLIAFIPYEKTDSLEKHIVYSKLDDSIITYKNNQLTSLTIPSNTTVYEDDIQATFQAKKSSIELGDILYIHKNHKGESDYVIFKEGYVDGPYMVTPAFNLNSYTSAKIFRNGKEAQIADIQNDDIIYYISDLNMLLGYSTKVTGIYENATPNKDVPTSITVSGTNYKIESSEAFSKLSSGGEFKFGDTVTLLLGKDNNIADVISSTSSQDAVYGYLYNTGRKQHSKSDLSIYTDFYISVVTPDGQTNEYIADKNYEDYKNSVKRITFKNGIATAESVSSKTDYQGAFDWNNKKLGNFPLADDIKIIDVSTTDPNKNGAYCTVFPTRLDGVTLKQDNILFAEKNNKDKIAKLILKDVTGDFYSYGLVLKAENNSNIMSVSGDYTIDINGVSTDFTTNGKTYGIEKGIPAKIVFSKDGILQSAESISSLSKIEEKITSVTSHALIAGNRKYPISDKAIVYKKESGLNYTIIPISEIVSDNNFSLSAYYDKNPLYGGSIRVIIASD